MKLFFVLCFLLPVLSHGGELRLHFIGNQAFEISDGQITLLTDFPYRSGYGGYMKYEFAEIRPKGDVLCLITHGHADHFESSLFEKTSWAIYGPPDVRRKILKSRVVSEAIQFQFKELQVEAIETPHAAVNHYSYLVTWQGKRFYFSGDTESADALLRHKNLDVAFVTPWLLSTVNKTGDRIDAKKIVIYHHESGEDVAMCGNCRMLQQSETISLSELLK